MPNEVCQMPSLSKIIGLIDRNFYVLFLILRYKPNDPRHDDLTVIVETFAIFIIFNGGYRCKNKVFAKLDIGMRNAVSIDLNENALLLCGVSNSHNRPDSQHKTNAKVTVEFFCLHCRTLQRRIQHYQSWSK